MARTRRNRNIGLETVEAGGNGGVIQDVMERMTDLDRAILERRAQDLARVSSLVTDDQEMLEMVTFYLGGEAYAVEVRYVHQVRPLERFTPVPCTPDFVVGVANIQGEILSLLDFRRLLGVRQEGITDLMEIIVVEATGLRVGLMANRVDEVRLLALDGFQEPPATVNQIGAEFVKGVTPGGLILLDLEAMLGNGRVIIDEEVQ